jgi:uncharacterized protein
VAQFLLGNCYYDYDRGVRQDLAEGVRWWRKAAEQGHAEAQYKLAECYHYGKVVSQDPAEAVKWYRKAAEQGHEEAKKSLSFFREKTDDKRHLSWVDRILK